MPNNTPTYWSAAGESLHTYARSIESLGPGLRAAPFRGEDVVIPGRSGQVWVPKDVDSRTLPLGMWVRGTLDQVNPAGNTRNLFDENWNNLVRLLWQPEVQFDLTKRFYDTFQGANAFRSATAKAEFSSGLEPTMIGKNAARFIVDLKLANPYFYDDNLQQFTLVNGDQTIHVRGNAPTRRVALSIAGSRNNVIVRNKTRIPHQVQYAADLSSGWTANINAEEYTSSTQPASGVAYDSSIDVRHSGHRAWLELYPGPNIINLSSTSGVGAVNLSVRGAWL